MGGGGGHKCSPLPQMRVAPGHWQRAAPLGTGLRRLPKGGGGSVALSTS